jgi:hypothetical protein
VVNGKFDVILATAPVGCGSIMRTCAVGVALFTMIVTTGTMVVSMILY